MAHDGRHIGLSATVLQVIEQFTAAMRADGTLDNHVIDRLEKLLREGIIPKTDEMNAALFGPPLDLEK
jgi:hypothetical protein